MNKRSNNKSNNNVNKRVTSLTNKVNNLTKRLNQNAPVAIGLRNKNAYKDSYETSGCERISDVTVLNTSYSCIDLFINPANNSLFPWLSGIAKKYDKYRFKKLIFRFIPSIPTNEGGNVYIGIDYNTLDPPPPSSIDFCQLTHWTTNVVWKPNSIGVDLSGIDWHYTRSGPVANADYKTYDIGRLFFATENISYSSNVGYFEVDYKVEFCKRQPDYISVTPSTNDTMIWSWTNGTTGTSLAANDSLTIPAPSVDTSDGEITYAGSDMTFVTGGVYQISVTTTSANSNYIYVKVNGTTVTVAGRDSTFVVEIDSGDKLSFLNSTSNAITVYNLSVVKLN